MALVLKIAIASAVLAAAFVYGTEHGPAGTRGSGRVSLGELERTAPAAAGRESGRPVRIIAPTSREPA